MKTRKDKLHTSLVTILKTMTEIYSADADNTILDNNNIEKIICVFDAVKGITNHQINQKEEFYSEFSQNSEKYEEHKITLDTEYGDINIYICKYTDGYITVC